ncbi:IS3 family transposase [Lysinibacillus endophyticus]|uniref:IS3 family transposase n=1 Tax=Ureibacillus endophyticus TaxID=1978490 RepID=UPI003135DA66
MKRVDLPEATYHYHIKQMKKQDPNQEWETLILKTFEKHKGRYGYRRIHAELKAQGH